MHVTLNTTGILAICAAPAVSAYAAAVFTARRACRYTDRELDKATDRLNDRIAAEVIRRATAEATLAITVNDRIDIHDAELTRVIGRHLDTRTRTRPPVRWHDSAGNTGELADQPHRPTPIKPNPDLLTTRRDDPGRLPRDVVDGVDLNPTPPGSGISQAALKRLGRPPVQPKGLGPRHG